MLRGLDGARVCRVKTTRGAHALCENRDLRVSVCVLRPYSIRGIFIWPQYICKIIFFIRVSRIQLVCLWCPCFTPKEIRRNFTVGVWSFISSVKRFLFSGENENQGTCFLNMSCVLLSGMSCFFHANHSRNFSILYLAVQSLARVS